MTAHSSGFNKFERRHLDMLRRRLEYLCKRVNESGADLHGALDWDRREAAAIRWALDRITGQEGNR